MLPEQPKEAEQIKTSKTHPKVIERSQIPMASQAQLHASYHRLQLNAFMPMQQFADAIAKSHDFHAIDASQQTDGEQEQQTDAVKNVKRRTLSDARGVNACAFPSLVAIC